MSTFANTLRAALEDREISIARFADMLGISHHTLRSYVQGRAEPSAKNALKIAKALDVTVEYLLEGKEAEITAVNSDQKKAIDIWDRIIDRENQKLWLDMGKALESKDKSA